MLKTQEARNPVWVSQMFLSSFPLFFICYLRVVPKDLRGAICFPSKFGSARLSQCKREHRHDFVMTARALCSNHIQFQMMLDCYLSLIQVCDYIALDLALGRRHTCCTELRGGCGN